ncbi:MAG: ABC transporter substrate-binding protein [Actinobacteria bacterium]|nr:ABC transporter substrate-binding protein [Actinomycetota bacterium]
MDRRRRLRRLLSASVITLAVVAAACDGGGEGEEGDGATASADIDEVTWALPDLPDVLLAPHDWTTYSGAVLSLVEEGSLAFGDDLSLQPALAESWEVVDPTHYLFTLRDGVTFHDGSPLTADDVVFTVEWNMDPDNESQLAAFFGSVESVEATADNEVTVTLTEPDAQFQYSMAHMSGFVMNKAQLESAGVDFGTPAVLPLGTGPYKLVEFVPDDHVTLERYEGYWGDQGPAKRIVIRQIPDSQTRLLAMQSGEIDGTFDVPVSEVDQWEGLDGVTVITAPSNGVYQLILDQETPPFDDIHVRKAIALAVDREGIVQAVLNGKGAPALAINPPGIWSGVLDEASVNEFYGTIPTYRFDLDAARDELAQSSVPDGFEFSVPVPNTDPVGINSFLAISETLAQIGITMNVQQVDPGEWLDVYFAHEDLGAQLMSYFPDYADPANYPYLFYYSGNAVANGLNGSNYKNPDVDAAIETALQSSDTAARADALERAIAQASEDVATVPIIWPDSAMAISSDLRLDGYSAFWYNIPWAIRGFGTA